MDPGCITTPQSIPEFAHAQKSQNTIRAQTLLHSHTGRVLPGTP